MYHCHVEATEHMQMGMLGNLYVRPKQNRLPDGTELGSHIHSNPDWNADRNMDDPLNGDKYVYNDEDGSSLYDVEFAIQIGSFDPAFHDASETVQPLPFADMLDKYPMLNGRGYPDTTNPNALPAPAENGGKVSQKENALIEATVGEKILLRLSNLNVTRFYTLASSLPMKVVGKDAKLLRNHLTGENLYFTTNSVTLGGGEAYDVIMDTTVVPAGTYFLYTTNLNYLSNDQEDFGGMMTEIILSNP
jgi:FtsP/CotA-like multicopper oxidase with cupredoxin domain